MVRAQHSAILIAGLVLVAIAALSGCQQSGGAGFGWKPVFGDLEADRTPVLAKVGDVEITQMDLDQFIKDQPERMQPEFRGPEGEVIALNRMIDEALMVQGAVQRKLYDDPEVARALVNQRRLVLDKAMRNFGLLRGVEPTEEQLKDYYGKNLGSFRQMGLVRARHIELATKADADRAWARLQRKGKNDDWIHVCGEFSINEVTRKLSGDAGWLNEGSVVPSIEAEGFSTIAAAAKTGLNPPIKIGDHWHIIEVTHRDFERASTFEESREAVRTQMMPEFQAALIRDYLKSARAKYGVRLEGRFAAGQVETARKLYERAVAIDSPLQKVEMLRMVADNYPEYERADDALFMAGNTALDSVMDATMGVSLLKRLVAEYPKSEFVADAKVLIENAANPNFRNPTSIEDLKH